jgi:hypothetical protein
MLRTFSCCHIALLSALLQITGYRLYIAEHIYMEQPSYHACTPSCTNPTIVGVTERQRDWKTLNTRFIPGSVHTSRPGTCNLDTSKNLTFSSDPSQGLMSYAPFNSLSPSPCHSLCSFSRASTSLQIPFTKSTLLGHDTDFSTRRKHILRVLHQMNTHFPASI